MALRNKRAAIFLDRDGILIKDVHLLTHIGQMRVLPSVPKALAILHKLGYLLVGVTNQTVIARGMATEDQVRQLNQILSERLYRACKARIVAFYVCPHHPQADLERYRLDCDCRKPKPGMLLQAAEDWGFDLSASYMVGDRPTDLSAGQAAGCHTVWVQSGKHHEPRIVATAAASLVRPDYTCCSLLEAAGWIQSAKRRSA